MKAVRIHKHGGPEVLSYDDIIPTDPQPDEVVLDMQAWGLNHLDIWVRNGIPSIPLALPSIMGSEGAGRITKLGSQVKDLQPGDHVVVFPCLICGLCRACERGDDNLCEKFRMMGEHTSGVMAEKLTLPARQVVKIDPQIPWPQAAAFTVTYLTAWHMLVTKGRLSAKDQVLVLAASSGVGSAAVKIAKHLGARVIATAGDAQKMELARALGADEVLNHYEEPAFAKKVKELTGKKGVDIVCEHVGAQTWAESVKSLAIGGRLVLCGATTGFHAELDLRHLFAKQYEIIGSTMGTRKELIALAELMKKPSFWPKIDHSFKLAEIRQAHELLEQSRHFGKIVLEVISKLP